MPPELLYIQHTPSLCVGGLTNISPTRKTSECGVATGATRNAVPNTSKIPLHNRMLIWRVPSSTLSARAYHLIHSELDWKECTIRCTDNSGHTDPLLYDIQQC